MGSPTPWGWIAGAVFVIVMLALVFTGSEATRTANNEASPPAATTTAPPAITVPPPADDGPRRTARPITAIQNNAAVARYAPASAGALCRASAAQRFPLRASYADYSTAEGSRAMSSSARVTATSPAAVRRTTLTVPAYSGEPE